MEHTADLTDNNTNSTNDITHATTNATGLRRSMFERRNRFTLRLGRRTAIPVILALHDPKSFTEVMFQSILSLMKDKIIKYLQYDPYHGQLRVVSDLPTPHAPVSCTELQTAHHTTLLYYFTLHDPPSFVVRNTARTVLRTGPALQVVQSLPNKESEPSEHASNEAEQLSSEEEHVEDDERSWHSLHATDHATREELSRDWAEDEDEEEEHVTEGDETRDQLAGDWSAASPALQEVRSYESVRLLSHVLVLETVSSEHSLTHLLTHQARDHSPPPLHQVSRYFQQPTQGKKRKSAGSGSTRGRKKAKK
eukprot:TRINITY_DN9542_c0_g1_i1.p1 TRINITY_DN9542_c0_g1~~TRINITY_DN9542_c0_g1_i1.p1  ORF type:complete len:308 (-),score=105.69 TRINITY_DN9542_c0_g1_i1:629-1552(-)